MKWRSFYNILLILLFPMNAQGFGFWRKGRRKLDFGS